MTRCALVTALTLPVIVTMLVVAGCSSNNSATPNQSSSKSSQAQPANAAAPRVTATVKVGKNPLGVAVDSAGHNVYVTNNGDDTVSVVDTRSNTTVGAPIKVG